MIRFRAWCFPSEGTEMDLQGAGSSMVISKQFQQCCHMFVEQSVCRLFVERPSSPGKTARSQR